MNDLTHAEGIVFFITNICVQLKEKEGMEAVKLLMGKYESVRSMALFGYKMAESEFGKIEDLPLDRKNELWDESGLYTKGKKFRVDWCKAIHYLENYFVK